MILQTINKRLSMTLKCSLLSVEMRKLLFSAFKKGKRKRVSETEDEANEELSEASNIIEDTVFEASGLPEELLNVPVANLHDNNIALVCSIAHSKHSIEVTTKIVQECFRYYYHSFLQHLREVSHNEILYLFHLSIHNLLVFSLNLKTYASIGEKAFSFFKSIIKLLH